jgi:uncharacterized protein
MYNLGYAFEHGEGMPANRDEAIRWYRKAADLGVRESKAALKRLGVSE